MARPTRPDIDATLAKLRRLCGQYPESPGPTAADRGHQIAALFRVLDDAMASGAPLPMGWRPTARPATVRLYEDNAGGLHLWHAEGGRGYSHVGTEPAAPGAFPADARALAETSSLAEWNVTRLDREPRHERNGSMSLLATWYESGDIVPFALPGRAGAAYLAKGPAR